MMRPRIALGRFLPRLGGLIQELALMVMGTEDLVRFSRRTYAKSDQVRAWGEDAFVDSGLTPEEASLLEKTDLKQGRLLVLGLGGGREAIHLAGTGFETTGVDFIPAMVEKAKENATRRGVRIEGVVQEISTLDAAPGSWDLVWLSSAMYSCIPTRKRRVGVLKRVLGGLKPGGFFICQFHWDPRRVFSPRKERVKKLIAWLTLGNIRYEKGDLLWHNVEFIHAFSSLEDIRSEFLEGEFDIIQIRLPEQGVRGGAILRKAAR